MIPNIGGPELIILLVLVLLLFGAKRIPELARGLGSGMREFKKSSTEDYDEVEGENKEKSSEKKDDFDSAKADLDEDEKKAEARSEAPGSETSEESGETRQEQRG